MEVLEDFPGLSKAFIPMLALRCSTQDLGQSTDLSRGAQRQNHGENGHRQTQGVAPEQFSANG